MRKKFKKLWEIYLFKNLLLPFNYIFLLSVLYSGIFFRLSTGVLQRVPPYPQKFAFSGTVPFGSYPNMQIRIKKSQMCVILFYERPFSILLHIAVELKLINMIVLGL